MLVPENQQAAQHVVSMFLATGGAGGHLLGSDEKEIIYLVFGIIDLQNKEVSDQQAPEPRNVREKKEKKIRSGPRSIREIPEKHVFRPIEVDLCVMCPRREAKTTTEKA
jgi:hypothetical protein